MFRQSHSGSQQAKFLILLHGALGSMDQLHALAKSFEKEYNVCFMNFSGHGGEPFREEFSIPAFADEVVAYMSQHQIDKASFFGYSMGGYVAMYIARIFPELVEKVITLGTKYYWDEEVAEKEVRMLNPDVIEAKVPAFAAQLRTRHAPTDWKVLLLKTSGMLTQMGRENVLQLEDYKRIDQKCLILRGEDDKMVTREETVAVSEALPNGQFRSLPGTPHMIEQIDITVLHETIREFLISDN